MGALGVSSNFPLQQDLLVLPIAGSSLILTEQSSSSSSACGIKAARNIATQTVPAPSHGAVYSGESRTLNACGASVHGQPCTGAAAVKTTKRGVHKPVGWPRPVLTNAAVCESNTLVSWQGPPRQLDTAVRWGLADGLVELRAGFQAGHKAGGGQACRLWGKALQPCRIARRRAGGFHARGPVRRSRRIATHLPKTGGWANVRWL